MAKYDDRTSAGRSQACPYRPGEHSSECHTRRLRTGLKDKDTMAAWCQEHGLALTVANQGHHWQVRGDGFKADWWPSSAKLVMQGRWERVVTLIPMRSSAAWWHECVIGKADEIRFVRKRIRFMRPDGGRAEKLLDHAIA